MRKPSIAEGRIKLAQATFAVFCIAAISIIQYNVTFGPNRLVGQIIRLCFTLALCAGVWKGIEGAKWTSVGLYFVGSVIAATVFLPRLVVANPPLLILISAFADLATYVYYTYLLLFSKDVNAYLDWKSTANRR